MGGPPGVGALIVREGVAWRPLFEGGSEEAGRRSGRLHPALIGALGLTVAAARRRLVKRAARATRLRRRLELACVEQEALPTLAMLPEAERLPGHLHLRLPPGLEAEPMLVGLEGRGIRAESGSPCARGGVPSRILRACGWSDPSARSALLLRAAAGHPRDTSERFGRALHDAGQHLRAIAP
jgi:cysteine desulfurase